MAPTGAGATCGDREPARLGPPLLGFTPLLDAPPLGALRARSTGEAGTLTLSPSVAKPQLWREGVPPRVWPRVWPRLCCREDGMNTVPPVVPREVKVRGMCGAGRGSGLREVKADKGSQRGVRDEYPPPGVPLTTRSGAVVLRMGLDRTRFPWRDPPSSVGGRVLPTLPCCWRARE